MTTTEQFVMEGKRCGYSMAHADLAQVLLDLKTNSNQEFLIELLRRFKHYQSIREVTNYSVNES